MSGMYLDVNSMWYTVKVIALWFYYNRYNLALGFVFVVFVWISYKLSISDYFQG